MIVVIILLTIIAINNCLCIYDRFKEVYKRKQIEYLKSIAPNGANIDADLWR